MFTLESHCTFVATQRAIEVTKSKGPQGVAQQAKEKPEEKARGLDSRSSKRRASSWQRTNHTLMNQRGMEDL